MSYDMQIGDESFSYTYNVSVMWYAAQPEKGIRAFYGMTGREAIAVQCQILTYMIDVQQALIQHEPSNGWGSYQGALEFVAKLITASVRNLDNVWEGD